MNVKTQVANPTYFNSVNMYGVHCGGDLHMWESSGWIKECDPYGWFQVFAMPRTHSSLLPIVCWHWYVHMLGVGQALVALRTSLGLISRTGCNSPTIASAQSPWLTLTLCRNGMRLRAVQAAPLIAIPMVRLQQQQFRTCSLSLPSFIRVIVRSFGLFWCRFSTSTSNSGTAASTSGDGVSTTSAKSLAASKYVTVQYLMQSRTEPRFTHPRAPLCCAWFVFYVLCARV